MSADPLPPAPSGRSRFARPAADPTDGSPSRLGASLQLFSIPEALQTISASARSGVLSYRFADSALDLHLALKNGRIVAAHGRGLPRLSEVLLRLGLPPATVGAVGLARAAGGSPEQLAAVVRDRVPLATLLSALELRTITGLLLVWSRIDGRFEFLPGDPPPSGVLPGLAVAALVLEVARRTDEAANGAQTVGVEPSSVYSVADRVGDFSERIHGLTAHEWTLLGELDGERSLAEIGRSVVRPWDQLCASVGVLERAGLIEPAAGQRGVRQRYTPLRTGEIAPAFSLTSLSGQSFSLGGQRGRRTLLAFHRHAGCPFCNLRIRDLIRAHARLERVGIDVVAVFSADLNGLRERVGTQRPPFTLLADPDDAVHTLYGTGVRLLGMLQPGLVALWLEGRRLGVKHGSIDGAFARMPADVLVGRDLRVEGVLYGHHAAEHVPVEALERWGRTGTFVV